MTVKGYEAPVDLVLNYDFSNEGQALIQGVIETITTIWLEPYVDLGGTAAAAM